MDARVCDGYYLHVVSKLYDDDGGDKMTYGFFLSDEERVEKLVERQLRKCVIESRRSCKERARLQHLRTEFVLPEERQRRANARRCSTAPQHQHHRVHGFHVGVVLGSHCTMLFMR